MIHTADETLKLGVYSCVILFHVIQDRAHELLAERQSQLAASKIQHEEFELQRTIMRAKTRNLEAEVHAMQATKRGLDKEIAQLRTVISVYGTTKYST